MSNTDATLLAAIDAAITDLLPLEQHPVEGGRAVDAVRLLEDARLELTGGEPATVRLPKAVNLMTRCGWLQAA